MKRPFGLLMLVSTSLAAGPTPVPMGNLTQSQALRGSQARSLKTSERKLAGSAKMKLRLSRVEQLSDWVESLSPKNQGLLGFGTVVTFVSAGYLSSEAMEGEDNEGNSFTVDSWDEATWDATQVILQTTADVATNIQGLGKYAPLLGPAMATTLAVVDMFMPFEDDELTKDKVGVMIDEKLAKAHMPLKATPSLYKAPLFLPWPASRPRRNG